MVVLQTGNEFFNEKPTEGKVGGVPENLSSIPAHVDCIHINGIGRSNESYIRGKVNELFTATNFNEMLFKANEAQQRLQQSGCFKQVNTLIDVSNDNKDSNGYEITFIVEEYGRLVGGINTMATGATEGSLVFGCQLPNVFGRGERATVEHTLGSNSNKNTLLSFVKPIGGAKDMNLSFLMFNNMFPLQNQTTSYSSGGLVDFGFNSAPRVRHNFQWEGSWRTFDSITEIARNFYDNNSNYLPQSSTKSTIRHVITVDHRDQPVFPSTGLLVRMVQEFAGIGGDVSYTKHNADIQMNFPMPLGMVVQAKTRLGFLNPIDSSRQNQNINDLFFLTGLQTLRGFSPKSLGSDPTVSGGMAYWSSGLHLYTRFIPEGIGIASSTCDSVRTHFFLSCGNVMSSSFDCSKLIDSFSSLLSNMRVAYGLGLAMRLGGAQLEVNYCFPLRYFNEDKTVHGFQVGLEAEFL